MCESVATHTKSLRFFFTVNNLFFVGLGVNNNNKSLHECRGAMLCKSCLSDIYFFFLRIGVSGDTESTPHTQASLAIKDFVFLISACLGRVGNLNIQKWLSLRTEFTIDFVVCGVCVCVCVCVCALCSFEEPQSTGLSRNFPVLKELRLKPIRL